MRTLCLTLLLATAGLALAVCPNNLVEPPETCDDGNNLAGDGCSPLCLLEVPNLPPSCAGALASPDALWPPNHRLVPLAIDGVVDPEDDPIALTITAVAQDEPVDATDDDKDGDDCADATGVGTDVAAVRAERNGSGDGRVYHIAFRASDPSGGFCDGAVTVCVRHDNGKKGAVCVDQGPLYDSTAGVCRPDEDDDGDHGDDDCDDDCLPPPPPAAGSCDGVPVPAGITRRMERAQRLLARAQDAGPKRQRRLSRRAQANLTQAERVVGARLSGPCRVEYGKQLDQADRCGSCVADDGDDDVDEDDHSGDDD